MDVTFILSLCKRIKIIRKYFQLYLLCFYVRIQLFVTRRLEQELLSAMSGPCEQFIPVHSSRTFINSINSTLAESTDWWMLLPFLQISKICEISKCVSMNLCDVVIVKISSQAENSNKNDLRSCWD